MKKIRLGLFGLGRGSAFYNIIKANGGELVAVCERYQARVDEVKKFWGEDLAVYDNFDDFIKHDGLDGVFLCNCFSEHAPYAIKCMEAGIPVLSECTAASTMAEAVALVRACEKYNGLYMIAENYPFMLFNQEMRRVYEEGSLGELLYAEGEYAHQSTNLIRYIAEQGKEPTKDANGTTAGDRIKHYRPYEKHWRNYLPRTYYLTHSLAPLMWITGKTPKKVTAMPVYKPHLPYMVYCADAAAIMLVQNDDNSVFRITGHAEFGCREDSYRLCCTNGQIENIRGQESMVALNYQEEFVPENKKQNSLYEAKWDNVISAEEIETVKEAGHGGGDYFVIKNFFNCIRENKQPEMDIYFATTMAAVGILGFRSIMENRSYDIPNMRSEEERKVYENDNLTPFWGADGSAPTLRPTSDANFKQDPKVVDAYIEAITTPWSDGAPFNRGKEGK